MSAFAITPCMLALHLSTTRKFRVTVVLENVGGGSKNAAPVARQIMDFYFRDRVFDTVNTAQSNNTNKLGAN